ncbi:unnamed protein product [Sphagnum jensenii]|uniref:DUF4005 domain-containing protein n=1 Tax=Sphagnum jensenii TaxID=128206 RepID=A0ABP0WBF9_9BRYO
MIATEQKSAKVNWHSSIDFSSTTKPVPTPLPLPRMQENESEEEQAAIKIQQAFQVHLALKGQVRLQALVHGCIVRRQAATTLRALKALVRVQACVRGHWVWMSQHGQAVQQHIKQHRQLLAQPKAARKHEQAMANVFSQQLKWSTPQRNVLSIDSEPHQPHWDGWKPSTKKREAKPRLVSQPVHNGKAEPIPLPLPPPPKLPVPTTADSPMQNPAYSGKAPSAEQSLTTLVQDAALMPPCVDCNSAGDHEREGLGKASPKQSTAANKDLLNDIANNMKEVEGGENDLPVSFKPRTCHYMAAMESAKAKFRPQIRTESEESPRKHQKRLSFTGADQQAWLPLPNPSFKNHVHISLEGGVFIEKTADITGIESPIHRRSLGGDQTKGAVKWR